MKPIKFPEMNTTFAKDQPEYLDLPALVDLDRGTVYSCWELTIKERFCILFSGVLWFSQITHNKPLQPQRPSVKRPYSVTNPKSKGIARGKVQKAVQAVKKLRQSKSKK